MNHLKKFWESHQNLYEEITLSEFKKNLDENGEEKLGNKEVNKIIKFFKGIVSGNINDHFTNAARNQLKDPFRPGSIQFGLKLIFDQYLVFGKIDRIEIFVDFDNYYYVKIIGNNSLQLPTEKGFIRKLGQQFYYFKCDGLAGLESLFLDILKFMDDKSAIINSN